MINRKTKLCSFHKNGSCARKDACNFAHGEDELCIGLQSLQINSGKPPRPHYNLRERRPQSAVGTGDAFNAHKQGQQPSQWKPYRVIAPPCPPPLPVPSPPPTTRSSSRVAPPCPPPLPVPSTPPTTRSSSRVAPPCPPPLPVPSPPPTTRSSSRLSYASLVASPTTPVSLVASPTTPVVKKKPKYSPSALSVSSNKSSPTSSFKGKLSLYCSGCGKRQQWDDKGKLLTPVVEDDGKYKVSKGQMTYNAIMFVNREKSICDNIYCKKQVMTNPMSAVCAHCDSLLGPSWCPRKDRLCVNKTGTPEYGKRFNKGDDDDKKPCEYALGSKHLHGAIAGKLLNVGQLPKHGKVQSGSGACYGFVMVHW